MSSPQKNVVDMLLNKEIIENNCAIELRQLPKIIHQLIVLNNVDDQVNNYDAGSHNEAVLYEPHAMNLANKVKKNDMEKTSDFNRIADILSNSDNVISEKAYHPGYTLLQARIDSFKEWPATLSQQPADLAKAGFYYFGIKDMVKCFFCNGGLKNWDHNDDPFQDHVRWFPKCQFIRQLMGADYVDKIREKFKNMDSGFTNDYSNGSNSSQYKGTTSIHNNFGSSSSLNRNVSSSSNSKNKRPVSPRTLNSRLDTNIVRKITDANIITKESIKLSFEKKLTSPTQSAQNRTNPPNQVNYIYGEDFKNSFEMAQMSYQFDKLKQDKADIFKSISDLLIWYLPDRISDTCIKEIFQIKYGIYPKSVK